MINKAVWKDLIALIKICYPHKLRNLFIFRTNLWKEMMNPWQNCLILWVQAKDYLMKLRVNLIEIFKAKILFLKIYKDKVCYLNRKFLIIRLLKTTIPIPVEVTIETVYSKDKVMLFLKLMPTLWWRMILIWKTTKTRIGL